MLSIQSKTELYLLANTSFYFKIEINISKCSAVVLTSKDGRPDIRYRSFWKQIPQNTFIKSYKSKLFMNTLSLLVQYKKWNTSSPSNMKLQCSYSRPMSAHRDFWKTEIYVNHMQQLYDFLAVLLLFLY